MSDLISREEVLRRARPEYLNPQQEKLSSYNQGWNNALDEYFDRIKALPSAETSADLISRQAAIDALAAEFYNCADDYRTAVKVIGGIPSAEPKRVKGRWVEMLSYMNHTYKCSECGRLLVNVTDGKNNVSNHYPYCHCGADMRGEQDE